MIYIETEGSSYERGKIHGESLKKQINTMIDSFKAYTRSFGYTSFDLLVKDILDNTNFLSTAKKWMPDVIEEIKGIADGTGIDFNIMFVIQFIDELEWYVAHRLRKDYWKKLQDESMKTV